MHTTHIHTHTHTLTYYTHIHHTNTHTLTHIQLHTYTHLPTLASARMIQSRQRNNQQTKLEIYQSHSQCVVERRHHNLPHIQRQKWEFLWCGWYHEEWLCWYGEDPSTRKLKLESISSPHWEGTKQKVIYPLKHFLTKQKTTGHCEISNSKVVILLIQKANTSKQNQIKKPTIHQLCALVWNQ